MNAAQFKRVETVFEQACERDAAEQSEFLRLACADDPVVHEAVRKMLREQSNPMIPHEDTGLRGHVEDFRQRALWTGTDDQDAHPLPEQIGGYRIIRRIGEGGMGTVFEAEQENPRRTVALKLIRSGVGTRTMMQRFRREIELLGRLRHTGIAQIYEAGTAAIAGARQPYFVMELVTGLPLTEFANRHDLDARERLELIARLCDAVHHAHQRGIIHRDLKPANVLVDETIHGGQPKVLDFGVARAIDSDRHTTLHTDVGQLVGTLSYMSPEQALGDPAAIDIRSDVYAIGVLLYELLTGQPPYDVESCSIIEAARVIRETDPTPPSSCGRHLRGDPEIILGKALDKEKERRYQTAMDLAADIRRSLNDEPILAHRTTAMYQLRRFARRNKPLVGGVIATMLALVLGIIAATWFALDASAKAAAARWQAYRVSITAAASAMKDDDFSAAALLLDETSHEHRGWEWGYLRDQLAQSGADLHAPATVLGDICVDDARGQVLAALADGSVGVWNATSRELVETRATGLDLSTISTNTANDLVALGAADGAVVLWDRSADGMRQVFAEAGEVLRLEFKGDGSRLVVLLQDELIVLEPRSGEVVARRAVAEAVYRRERIEVQDVCIGPDGCIAIVRSKTGTILIWDPATGETIESPALAGLRGFGGRLAISPDGAILAVGSLFRDIYMLDIETAEVRRVLRGHGAAVWGLAFSPDGTLLASAGGLDGTVCIWDVDRGERRTTFFTGDAVSPAATLGGEWGSAGPHAVRFSADGDTVLMRASGATSLRVWPVERQSSRLLGTLPDYVYAVACSPDGRHVAAGLLTDKSVTVWNIDGDVPVVAHELTGGWSPLVFPRDSTELWTARTLWDLTGVEPRSEPIHATSGLEHALDRYADPDMPRRLGTSGLRLGKHDRFNDDGSVRTRVREAFLGGGSPLDLTAVPTEELIATLGTDVHGSAYSPDGRHIATAHADGTVRIWDVGSHAEVAVLRGHTGIVYCVEYSPDGTRLASGSNDATIRIWSVETGESLLELRGHESYVHDLVFSPDGTRIISGSGDKTARMWMGPHLR